jgi:hypothetical protein
VLLFFGWAVFDGIVYRRYIRNGNGSIGNSASGLPLKGYPPSGSRSNRTSEFAKPGKRPTKKEGHPTVTDGLKSIGSEMPRT